MRYRKGDELVLKVEEDFGYTDRTYRRVKVQVIGHNVDSDSDEAEYLVYVPPYEFMKGTWTLTERHASWYNVDHRFIGDEVIFIRARHPIYKHFPAPQGESCDNCKEFVEGAQRGNDGYVCRACRFNPYR
jgi:hypothetical protein